MPPVWFWKKFPLCVLVIARSGAPLMMVLSVARVVAGVQLSAARYRRRVHQRAGGIRSHVHRDRDGEGLVTDSEANPTLVQVSVASVQFQLEPLIAVAVIPAGRVSVTVMVPLVAPPPVFFTVME